MASEKIRFGPFELDTVRRVLYRDGGLVSLRPKALSLLLYLVEHRDRIVTKEELLDFLWPDGFGTEANLTVNIAAVRRAVGEQPREHRYVVTVPTIGYRFVSGVSASNSTETADRASDGPKIEIESLAVLPISVIGAGPEQNPELLSLGIADSLIEGLSSMARLSVRSAGDVRHLAVESPLRPATEIGRELQVEAVLTGELHLDPETSEVTLELRKSEDGALLWSHRLEQPCCELHALPVRLTRTVVRALRSGAPGTTAQLFHTRYTERDDAFQLYLQGRFHFWNGVSPKALRRSIECFDRAISLDPSYALAHSGTADAYLQLWSLGVDGDPVLMRNARESAGRALEIDPLLSDAHRTMAMVAMLLDWDWAVAREHFLAALEYQPHNALAYDGYAFFLAARGDCDQALEMVRRAQQLDPLSLKIHADVATILHFAGEHDRAAEILASAVERDPHFFLGYLLQGWVCVSTGRAADAVGYFEKLPQLIGENAWTDSLIGTAHAAAGQEAQAREYLTKLEGRERVEFVQPSFFCMLHMHLGETELALDRLEGSYERRYSYMAFMDVDPLWAPLRDEPRFHAVREKVMGPRD